MSFNELPSLFFLFENLVNKRFESVTKNDRSKFEEFRKVHQYHAIRIKFYSLKLRDVVMLLEDFNAEDLEIISNHVNWTDQEVTKYGFLGKNENGKLKFHDQAFTDFFIAQYFHDNIVHRKGNPTDDEMELRLRFFFYITNNLLDQYSVINEFIMAMVDDQNGKVFSNQVRMLMKYKFYSLLDPYFKQDLDYVDKISKIFAKDEEILGNLWGINDNQPFFLRFFRFTRSDEFMQYLKKIAERFFKTGADLQAGTNITSNSNKLQAENIFRGKNQVLNVLQIIHEKKDKNFTKDILDVTKYEVSDEILTKLNQTEDFLDFVDSSNFSLTDKKEFFMSNAYKLIVGLSRWNAENLTKLWNRMKKYLTKNELKLILIQKDRHFNHTHLFLLPSTSDLSYVQTFLNIIRTNLNADEIKELMSQRRTLCQESFLTHYLKLAKNKTVYELTYNFAKEFSTHEELKSLLFDNKDIPFTKKIAGNEEMFPLGTKILSEFYTKDEIQDILMKVDDRQANILFWVIDAFSCKPRLDVVDYLRETFKGQDEKLKIMFKNRNNYDQNIFIKFNNALYSKNAQPLFDLAKEIFTDDEIKELLKK